MKSKSKVLLLVLCAVLLMAGSVFATVAFLTDRTSVANTFTVGNVDITLDEAEVTPDGVPVKDDEENVIRTEEGNEYHLVPNQTYVKDPTVTVEKGSEPSYVRMLVTINCISELKAILGDDFLPQNYVDGWDAEKWPCVGVTPDAENNTLTYEFRYYTTVDAYEADADIVLEPLFTKFTLPGEITGEELATLKGQEAKEGLTITVIGHAIQAATFEADMENELTAEDVAWAAFDAQNTKENG